MGKLSILESFLRELTTEPSEDGKEVEGGGRFLSQEGYGTRFLSKEEVSRFRDVVHDLMSRYGSRDVLSRHAVEAEVRRAIFSALGEIGADDRGSPERLERAILDLAARLGRQPSIFHCFVQLDGAGVEGLPFSFGKLRFVVFNDSQLRKFRAASREHKVAADELEKRLQVLRDVKRTGLWDSPCVIAEVRAKDSRAAERIALEEVRGVLDALNFFSDLTPYQHGRVFLPGERGRVLTTSMVLEDSSSWYSNRGRAGPPTPFSFAKLRGDARHRAPRQRIHAILQAEAINPVDELLLSGVRWAGRAATEIRDEHAFLWYAIALESVLLPEDAREELGYRLRMRAAHLLAAALGDRREIVKTVRDLYRIRSRIVHSGRYSLSKGELEGMRAITKAVLLRLLAHRVVRQLKSVEEYRTWFEDRMLQ